MEVSLKVGCLLYAVGKQLSIPMIDLEENGLEPFRYQSIIVDSGRVDAYMPHR